MAKSRSRKSASKVCKCKCKCDDGTKCKNVANPSSKHGYCTMHHKKRSARKSSPKKSRRASKRRSSTRKSSTRRKYGFAGAAMAMQQAAKRAAKSPKSSPRVSTTFKSVAQEYESLLRQYADLNNQEQDEKEISQLVADFTNDLDPIEKRQMINELRLLL